jgi:hypothetical protein
MPRKPKFKPTVTRVKLNPEQAVLACGCWSTGTTVQYNWSVFYGLHDSGGSAAHQYCYGVKTLWTLYAQAGNTGHASLGAGASSS